MSARMLEYKHIIEDVVANLWLLDEEERQILAAILSSAETKVLAAMADNYPPDVVQ